MMALAIVYLLEMVDVNGDDGNVSAMLIAIGKQFWNSFVEIMPVVKAC